MFLCALELRRVICHKEHDLLMVPYSVQVTPMAHMGHDLLIVPYSVQVTPMAHMGHDLLIVSYSVYVTPWPIGDTTCSLYPIACTLPHGP